MTTSKLLKALTINVPIDPRKPWLGFRKLWNREDLTVTLEDYKRLERNKYAPWGRGDLGGAPV